MNNYQNYEEYMRSVLGYSPYAGNNYTYQEPEDTYDYSNMPIMQNTEELNRILSRNI